MREGAVPSSRAITFMKPSVTRSWARMPPEEAIAVVTSPAVQTPKASSPARAVVRKAAASAAPAGAGSRMAVWASQPWWVRTGAGCGRPGYSPGPAVARAAAAATARPAAARRPSSSGGWSWPRPRAVADHHQFGGHVRHPVAWGERANRESRALRVTVTCACSPGSRARARSASSIGVSVIEAPPAKPGNLGAAFHGLT